MICFVCTWSVHASSQSDESYTVHYSVKYDPIDLSVDSLAPMYDCADVHSDLERYCPYISEGPLSRDASYMYSRTSIWLQVDALENNSNGQSSRMKIVGQSIDREVHDSSVETAPCLRGSQHFLNHGVHHACEYFNNESTLN